MRRYFPGLLVCSLIPIHSFGLAFASQPSIPPQVTLEAGVLEGTHFGSAQTDAAFLGIPYAAPPIGDLRWKPAQPVPNWIGIRKATHFGASCPQLPATWLPELGWSEDCLYLNVWTPQLSASAKLPVFVWIHGGGNQAGRSQQDLLGPALSRLGIVVVSLNYRLGPFGFFAHPGLTAESKHHSSGNYGLLDQLQALRWVRENISRFGGDPARITIAGQSAGSVDACLLMASPMAAGMFQRAIMQSGDCQSALNEDIRAPFPYNSISGSGESAGKRLASDLGLANTPDTLKRLRAVPVGEILKMWSKDRDLRFDAIVDGWIVPEQPAKIFAEGKQVRVPILTGTNADEATVFGHNVKTVDQYWKYLRRDSGQYADREFQLYPVSSETDVPAQYLRLQNDSFAYGAYSIAQSMTRAGENAYLYYFSYVDTGRRARLGAFHGEELMFLSKSFRSDWGDSRGAEKLGEAMRAYWTQFVKTGNPNTPGLPEWRPYESDADQCMELGSTLGLRRVPHLAHLQGLEHIMKQIIVQTSNARPAL